MGSKTCEEIILNFALEAFREKLKEMDHVNVNLGAKINLTYHIMAFDYHPEIINSPSRSSKSEDQIISKGLGLVKDLFENLGFFDENTFVFNKKTPEQKKYLDFISPNHSETIPTSTSITAQLNDNGSGLSKNNNYANNNEEDDDEGPAIELDMDDSSNESLSHQSSSSPVNKQTLNRSSKGPIRLRITKRPPAKHLREFNTDGQRFSGRLIKTGPKNYRLDLNDEVSSKSPLVRQMQVSQRMYKHQVFFCPEKREFFDPDYLKEWNLKAVTKEFQNNLLTRFMEDHGNTVYRCLLCSDCTFQEGRTDNFTPLRNHIARFLFLFPCPYLTCRRFENPLQSYPSLHHHVLNIHAN